MIVSPIQQQYCSAKDELCFDNTRVLYTVIEAVREGERVYNTPPLERLFHRADLDGWRFYEPRWTECVQ